MTGQASVPVPETAGEPEPDRRDRRFQGVSHRLAQLGLLAYLLVPAALTLTPNRPDVGAQDFASLTRRAVAALTLHRADISIAEIEVLANVLLLVPVGLLLPFALRSLPLVGLLSLAAAGSLAVEVLQHLVLTNRVASFVDVLSNTGGAAIGLILATDLQRLARLLRRRRPHNR